MTIDTYISELRKTLLPQYCEPISYQYRAIVEEYLRLVRERLTQGAETYGEASLQRPPDEIIGEIREEVADVSGWIYPLMHTLTREVLAGNVVQPHVRDMLSQMDVIQMQALELYRSVLALHDHLLSARAAATAAPAPSPAPVVDPLVASISDAVVAMAQALAAPEPRRTSELHTRVREHITRVREQMQQTDATAAQEWTP